MTKKLIVLQKINNLQVEPRTNDKFNNSFCAADQEIDSNSNNNESNEDVPSDDDSRYYAFPEKYITSFEK